MIIDYLNYQIALFALLMKRDIDGATWRYAAKVRPIVVCGRRGGFVVDATFDMTPGQRKRVAAIQFFIGCLLIAAGVTTLDALLGMKEHTGGQFYDGLGALFMFWAGLQATLNASVASAREMFQPSLIRESDNASDHS